MFAWGGRKEDENSSHLREELRVVFSKIKEEFEDHLESINQNTIEIQSSFEYLSRLANRVEKIEQRIARIDLDTSRERREVETVLLTRDEEEVFAILADSTRKRQLVTYERLAQMADVSKTFGAHLVASLIEKGIPVIKKFSNGSVFLELEQKFVEHEIKVNVVTLD